MSYCNAADLVNQFGQTELIELTDRENLGTVSDEVVSAAVARTDAEIDGYLRGRYDLPLPAAAAAQVNGIACDVTRYRLFGARATEEVRARYKDAAAWLRDVAAGRVRLLIPTETSQAAAKSYAVAAPAEVFSAATLARMP